MGKQTSEGGNTQYHATVDTEFSWDDFPLEQQEQMREEIISNVCEDIDRELIIQRALAEEWEDFFSDVEVEEFIGRLFTEADDETIARCIPEEVVEQCVEEQMATSTPTSDAVVKAQRETLISLFRVVAIGGAALGGIISASFAIAGGYPLAVISGLMTAFMVYAYRYNFEEV